MALGSITIKVAKTLSQVDEILEIDPTNQEAIKQAIEDAINKLHSKIVNGDVHLLLTDATEFNIAPKSEFKQFMYDVTGEKGPYKVVKTYKSWVGISDGVYEIENCPKYIPVSWCKKTPEKRDHLKVLSVFLAICSVIQSAALLLLLI
jgi:hypothetical protein